jgi:hypothetical protein
MEAHNPAGLHELVNELGKRLAFGESLNNKQLRELSSQFLGGTRAEGVWTPREACDALETAVPARNNRGRSDGSDAELLDKLSALLRRLRRPRFRVGTFAQP